MKLMILLLFTFLIVGAIAYKNRIDDEDDDDDKGRKWHHKTRNESNESLETSNVEETSEDLVNDTRDQDEAYKWGRHSHRGWRRRGLRYKNRKENEDGNLESKRNCHRWHNNVNKKDGNEELDDSGFSQDENIHEHTEKRHRGWRRHGRRNKNKNKHQNDFEHEIYGNDSDEVNHENHENDFEVENENDDVTRHKHHRRHRHRPHHRRHHHHHHNCTTSTTSTPPTTTTTTATPAFEDNTIDNSLLK